MSNSNMSKKSELEIIQQHLESVSGNALLISNDSDLINSILSDNLQVLSNPDKTISDHVDTLLLTNSLFLDMLELDMSLSYNIGIL